MKVTTLMRMIVQTLTAVNSLGLKTFSLSLRYQTCRAHSLIPIYRVLNLKYLSPNQPTIPALNQPIIPALNHPVITALKAVTQRLHKILLVKVVYH